MSILSKIYNLLLTFFVILIFSGLGQSGFFINGKEKIQDEDLSFQSYRDRARWENKKKESDDKGKKKKDRYSRAFPDNDTRVDKDKQDKSIAIKTNNKKEELAKRKGKSIYLSHLLGLGFHFTDSFIYRNDSKNSKELSSTRVSTIDFSLNYLQQVQNFLFQVELFAGQILSLEKNNQDTSQLLCTLEWDKNCKRLGLSVAGHYKIPLGKIFQNLVTAQSLYAGLNYKVYRHTSLTLNRSTLYNSHFQAGYFGLSFLYIYRFSKNVFPLVQLQLGRQHFFSQAPVRSLSSDELSTDVIHYSGWDYSLKTGISFRFFGHDS